MAPPPASDGATVDSEPLTVTVDPMPAGKRTMALTADVSGPVAWTDVIVVGNGHVVAASGSVTIKNSLVTGLGSMTRPGITGASDAVDIEGSIFENTGAIVLDATGTAVIKDNELRANNLLTFVANDPDAVPVIQLGGKSRQTKLFQGNRVGAGRVVFHAAGGWLVGGDTDELSNVVIGPRGTFSFENGATDVVFRGNYVHHAYRGGWSQGFNLAFTCRLCAAAEGTNVLSEHNFLRGGSWPVQSLVGEFRYNVVYGYGHTWVRSAVTGASIHHNLFLPEGPGGLDAGVQLYGGERGVRIFNNTFDGGGAAGDFTKAFVDLSGTVQVTSLRNNLFTFSRAPSSGPRAPAVKAAEGTLVAAGHNAFYDAGRAGGASGDAQLVASPFAGARPYPIDTIVDEGAVWAGRQKLSQILAAFRARYTPAAGSPVIDAGEPADTDSRGRRADIGAIDRDGHEQDRLGKRGPGAPRPAGPSTAAAGARSGKGGCGCATEAAGAPAMAMLSLGLVVRARRRARRRS
jgi:MYXO-CTERM domain-containing protein